MASESPPPPYDPPVADAGLGAGNPLGQVRRIFGIGLAVAAAAVAGAFTLALSSQPHEPAPGLVTIFPATFTEQGFAPGPLRRDATRQESRTAIQLARPVVVDARATEWIVARCDSGSVKVTAGGVDSTQPCTGQPVGVVALHANGKALRVSATVSATQHGDWGIAVYR